MYSKCAWISNSFQKRFFLPQNRSCCACLKLEKPEPDWLGQTGVELGGVEIKVKLNSEQNSLQATLIKFLKHYLMIIDLYLQKLYKNICKREEIFVVNVQRSAPITLQITTSQLKCLTANHKTNHKLVLLLEWKQELYCKSPSHFTFHHSQRKPSVVWWNDSNQWLKEYWEYFKQPCLFYAGWI